MKRLFLLAGALASTACASIMHGTDQDIGISSSPTGAKISVDNMPMGNTPVIAKLSRKDNHIVKIDLDGYAPAELTLTKGVSGWVWGNLAFGGVLGLAVDAISGGLYNLNPAQLQATLASQHANVAPTSNGVYVVLVKQPDRSWTKIGQLQRITHQTVGH
jgi:hypothetical protein